MKKVLLMALLCAFSAELWSQSEAQTEALLSSIEEWAGDQSDEQVKWLKKSFKPWLLDGVWRTGQIDTLIQTTERMRKDRLPFPLAGRGYLEAAQVLMNRNDTLLWEPWHAFIEALESKRSWKKGEAAFLAVSPKLFERGTIADDGHTEWRMDGALPRFEWDSVPLVRFIQGDLIGTGRGDRATILGTEGVWDVTRERFQGGAGRVTWAGTTLDSTRTYAEFDAFDLRLGGNSLQIPGALFYSDLVPDALPGKLTVKLQSNATPENKDYPRFETDANVLTIEGISPGVNYTGGITISGSRLQGTGTVEDRAQLEILHEDTLLFRIEALTYLFTDRGISAEKSAAMLFYKQDTIYHPECQFRLDHATGRLSLSRTEEGLSRQPFKDSYHDLEMDVEALQWVRGSTSIVLGGVPGATNRTATFASTNYFKREAFQAIQGMADRHPLQLLVQFERETGRSAFTTLDFAQFIRLNELSTRILLIDLANQGFLQMDLETLDCAIEPKALDFLQYAAGRKDYDVIRFVSQSPEGVNGKLSLLNGRLALDGVMPFQVSDSQDVRILPERGQIVIGENRALAFDGRVLAGNLELIGQGFGFDYDEFQITLSEVEEIKLQVDDPSERDRYGRPVKRAVQSSLREVTGTLKIDDPRNRSGMRSRQFTQYPVLTSKETSFVYYDEQRIQGGAYDRDRFYFAVDPFTMNNLDRFAPEDLAFRGTLVSAGILPDLEQPLELMADYSLGISTETTRAGKELYGGLARYTEAIRLDLQGLHGGGVIDFKTAHAEGDDFTFLPDEAIGVTSTFSNRSDEGFDVPHLMGRGGALRFAPYEHRLECATGRDSLVAFYDGVKFRGALTFVDSGMFATGQFNFDEAQLTSESFQLTQHHALSDSAGFRLRGMDDRMAFRTDAVVADVNFLDRIGDFEAMAGELKVELPLNQYEVDLARFRWFMDVDQIALESDRSFPEEGLASSGETELPCNYLSLHPGQDSLRFLSPNSRFDVRSADLACEGVKYLDVADAQIWPDSGKLMVRRLAALDELQRATVIADRTSGHHRITNARLDIKGRLDYGGEGNYIYKDVNGSPFELTFSKIFVDRERYETHAQGQVVVTEDFSLSPAFAYAGAVHLDASERLLRFDGGAKMMHPCAAYVPEWVAFDERIDPQAVAIPIGMEPQSIDRTDLIAGVVVSGRSPYTAYPTFMTERGDRDDVPLIQPEGSIRYDTKTKRYVISSEERFKDPESTANACELAVEGCALSSSGTIDLPVDYGLLQESMVGTAWVDESGQLRLKGTLFLDFLFDDRLLERIASQIPMWQETNPLDVFASGYDRALRTTIGEEAAEEAIADLSLTGQFKRVPKELQHTMVLSGIEFVYDPSEESFISEGPLGIVLLGGEQVFMQMKGKMEIQRMKTGDWLRLYLHGGEENWYYFDYRLGTMNVSTSDTPFFDILLEVKAKNRTIKEDGKRFGFQAMGSKKRRNDFVDRFREFD